jgi:LPS-assembly lipoprotein
VVSSEYATIAAEQTALENLARDVADRMVRRIALRLRAQEQDQ